MKGMELGTPELTPVHEPSPEAACAHACRQLRAPACGSVLLGALQEVQTNLESKECNQQCLGSAGPESEVCMYVPGFPRGKKALPVRLIAVKSPFRWHLLTHAATLRETCISTSLLQNSC